MKGMKWSEAPQRPVYLEKSKCLRTEFWFADVRDVEKQAREKEKEQPLSGRRTMRGGCPN